MRRDVTFLSKGQHCTGWLYIPDNLREGERAPAIVMANAISAVKEIYLPHFAERFVEAGFVVLLFDYRFLGGSEGEPRGQVLPDAQHDDIRNAISWLMMQPEVDPNAIGAWGISYGGAHVLHLAAFDKRIKAVVATIPAVNGWETLSEAIGPDALRQFSAFLTATRTATYSTAQESAMPVVSENGPAMIPGPEAYGFYTTAQQTIAPSWLNQITLESIEKSLEYNPTGMIELIAPTPLLMVLAEQDRYTSPRLAARDFARAGEPKKLVTLPCGHIEVYNTEPWFSHAADEAVAWFTAHLRANVPAEGRS